jgi:hypothetical protein
MAITYPTQLSSAQTITNGERKVFALLKDNLPDDFIVFHDRNLSAKKGARSLYERGIDFLIIKKGKGILALELKDAGIYNDGNGNLIQEWMKYGKKRSKPIDPIRQAKAQLNSLFRSFEKKTGLQIYGTPAVACAVFPDMTKSKFYGSNPKPQDSE